MVRIVPDEVVRHGAGRSGVQVAARSEPNVVVDANGDTVVDAAEDTVVAEDGEPAPVGVPTIGLDYAQTAEQWWAGFWANPAAASYVPEIGTWPNEVAVGANDDLQAVVDAAPDRTTFVLPAGGGPYASLALYGRSHLHFVAADPNDKPVLRGVYCYATAHAFHYLSTPPWPDGWVKHVMTTGTAADVAAYFDPPRDLYFKDVAFRQAEGVLSARNVPYSGIWENLPFYAIGYQDILLDGCTWDGYVNADEDGLSVGAPAPHPGLVYCTGGVRNVVVRNCALVGEVNAGNFGWTSAVYCDGARGCAFVDNTFSGKWHGAVFLFLTNDDFTKDWDGDESVEPIFESRNAKYLAVVGNESLSQVSQFASLTGEKTVWLDNVLHQTASGTVFVGCTARASQLWDELSHVYPHTGNVGRRNEVRGGGYSAANAAFWSHYTGSEGANGGIVGQSTITDNLVAGAVNEWIREDGDTPDEEPNVESGNQQNYVFP